MKTLFGAEFYKKCLDISSNPSYVLLSKQGNPEYVSQDMRRINLEMELYQGNKLIYKGKDTPNIQKEDISEFKGIDHLVNKLHFANKSRNIGQRQITTEDEKIYIEPKGYNPSIPNEEHPEDNINTKSIDVKKLLEEFYKKFE